jgi:NhaP-type Na+/H+ or K+/H+ antiporter
MKTYVTIMIAVSAMFAALLASAIHESQGTGRTALYCVIGIAAIWILGYLKARLFGWIRTGKGEQNSAD